MQDGILLINKPRNMTSRDVVNIVSKKLKTKKVGHTGTLDPLATGLLIVCVNKATKLIEILTCDNKTYVATVKLGYETDTLDITGQTIKREQNIKKISSTKLTEVMHSFLGSYLQEVPLYSATKVQGKKLYEYARNGESVVLPKKLVTINSIDLISFNADGFTFTANVSKGTYIRSLIRDIGIRMNSLMTLESLNRTQIGKFKLDDAIDLDKIDYNSLHDFKEYINFSIIRIPDELEKKIHNGAIISSAYSDEMVLFTDSLGNNVAIYKKDEDNKMCAFKVF